MFGSMIFICCSLFSYTLTAMGDGCYDIRVFGTWFMILE